MSLGAIAHRWLLTDEQIKRRRPLGALSGVAAFVTLGLYGAGVLPGVPVPITVMMSIFLTATVGGLSEYRSERGLWMFAALIGFFPATLWVLFVYHAIADAWRNAGPVDWVVTLDVSIASWLMGATIRLALSMGWWNWRLGRDAA